MMEKISMAAATTKTMVATGSDECGDVTTAMANISMTTTLMTTNDKDGENIDGGGDGIDNGGGDDNGKRRRW
jgi:hypothetical protein